jgi:ABC-type nickel/cobalt efflux system permease component RcnA
MTDWFDASGLAERMQGFVDSPGIAPVAFAFAFLAGAAHAVGPGHGKSLAAAYLIGSHGRVRDAAWLGGSVAVMHTLSVLVIAVAWSFFSLSELVRLEHLTAGLQIAAGLLVIGTGACLLRRGLRAARSGAGHGHGHGLGHGHDRRPGLLLLGISGGLTPSPGAFLVLVTGIFLGRSGFALLLVMTFGLGMASVLFGVGLLALGGSNVVVRAAESRAVLELATRVAPVLAAVAVTALGGALTAFGLTSMAGA